MRYTLLGLAVLLWPGLVHADRMRVTSYDMDDRGGTVRLESNAPIGEPWLRIEGRTVKIWFPHIDDVARFDHERESSDPIRALALRGGVSETALLRVELGTHHHIGREDIAISRDRSHAAVRLRVPSARPLVTATSPGAAAQPQAATEDAASPGAAAAATTAAQPKASQTTTAASQTGTQTTGLSGIGAASESTRDDELGTRDDDSTRTSPVWLLLSASVLLGFVWFGLQHLQRKRPVRSDTIQIVGARRLGHRQQLLIVRALGADHLLLCTNGRAERVASTPSAHALPANTLSSAERLQAPQPAPALATQAESSSQAGGIGLISRLSSQHRLRKLLDSVESENAALQDDSDANRDFGDELLTATQKRGALLQSLPAPAARQSDAVAGIARLRQRKTS